MLSALTLLIEQQKRHPTWKSLTALIPKAFLRKLRA